MRGLGGSSPCLLYYESDMRYPTDVKHLWESLEYIIKTLKQICKTTKTKQIRSKYNQLKREYIVYSRLRRKSYKNTKKMYLYSKEEKLNVIKYSDTEIEAFDVKLGHILFTSRTTTIAFGTMKLLYQ